MKKQYHNKQDYEKMYRIYQKGATLADVGKLFSISAQGVHQGFARWGYITGSYKVTRKKKPFKEDKLLKKLIFKYYHKKYLRYSIRDLMKEYDQLSGKYKKISPNTVSKYLKIFKDKILLK